MRGVEPNDRSQRTARFTLTEEEQESRAYVLIEEARLRCERLEIVGLRHFDEGDRQDLFREIHREIGMAGLFASTEIESWSRKILLEAARLRSESPIRGALDAAGILEIALGRACTAIEHCLNAPEPVDHMHLAHIHVLTGIDLLQ
jgi:hypothetical protein